MSATGMDGLLPAAVDFVMAQAAIWFAVFTIDTLRYLAGAGGVSIILFGLLGRWSATRRIQSRKASAMDVRREISYSLLTTAVYAVIALFTIEMFRRGWTLKYMDVADYGWGYALLSLPLVLVLHDAYFYWVHRAMHHPKLFARMHRVHHLSHTPTPWAAYSFAPLEAAVMALFMPLVLSFVPLHITVIFIFLAIMIVRNAMGHSGVEFHPRWWVDTPLDVLTTPTHHDLHHQKFRGNYGLYFTWWDRWMGTELPDYKATFRRAASGGRDQPQASTAQEVEG